MRWFVWSGAQPIEVQTWVSQLATTLGIGLRQAWWGHYIRKLIQRIEQTNIRAGNRYIGWRILNPNKKSTDEELLFLHLLL